TGGPYAATRFYHERWCDFGLWLLLSGFGQPHRPRFVCDFTLANSSGGVVPRSFSLKGASRGKSKLTWSFSGVIKGVPQPLDTLTKAFDLWKAATPSLQFDKVDGNADITMLSGPVEPAPGGIVAGNTTSDGRTITFNRDLIFQSNGPGGASFLSVAAHEIRHALGLGHATTDTSIMFPFNGNNEHLSPDDRNAIRALYGWSAQRKLQGGTEDTPAICACGNVLAMAWRGVREDHNIWFSTSTDGQNWTPQ